MPQFTVAFFAAFFSGWRHVAMAPAPGPGSLSWWRCGSHAPEWSGGRCWGRPASTFPGFRRWRSPAVARAQTAIRRTTLQMPDCHRRNSFPDASRSGTNDQGEDQFITEEVVVN